MTVPLSTRYGDEPCSDCGTSDNIVWFTDDVLWNEVTKPENSRWGDSDPILCQGCFIEAVERAGIYPTSWRLIPQYPVRRVAVDQ